VQENPSDTPERPTNEALAATQTLLATSSFPNSTRRPLASNLDNNQIAKVYVIYPIKAIFMY
jgi:hypothetical protein